MIYEIDYESGEAYYIQLRNQIILRIAASVLRNGDTLPSVRQMAELIGINMHTVNKAYAVLREEGFLSIDRRGSVVVINENHARALGMLREDLQIALARAKARGISQEEIHRTADEILNHYDGSLR